jgi:hypothetical protein
VLHNFSDYQPTPPNLQHIHFNRVLSVVGRTNCSGQESDTMITVNDDRVPVSYAVVGQRSLDLGDQ